MTVCNDLNGIRALYAREGKGSVVTTALFKPFYTTIRRPRRFGSLSSSKLAREKSSVFSSEIEVAGLEVALRASPAGSVATGLGMMSAAMVHLVTMSFLYAENEHWCSPTAKQRSST